MVVPAVQGRSIQFSARDASLIKFICSGCFLHNWYHSSGAEVWVKLESWPSSPSSAPSVTDGKQIRAWETITEKELTSAKHVSVPNFKFKKNIYEIWIITWQPVYFSKIYTLMGNQRKVCKWRDQIHHFLLLFFNCFELLLFLLCNFLVILFWRVHIVPKSFAEPML